MATRGRTISIWIANAALGVCAVSVAQHTTLLSKSAAGVPGNGGCESPCFALGGQHAAFSSAANNLVAGDLDYAYDIFVVDMVNGEVDLASRSSTGVQAGAWCDRPSLSADARFVAFESESSILVPGDTNGWTDVFVRDRQLGTTTRASVSSGGAEATNQSRRASLSADGRYVLFDSDAGDLVAGDTNGGGDVFLHDNVIGTTIMVDVSSAGAVPNADAFQGSLSADGRYASFSSWATNLVSPDTNATADVFVRDLLAAQTTRISVSSTGTESNGFSRAGRISATGRFVPFSSEADNLVSGDTNGIEDCFLHDRQTGVTIRVSVDSSGGEADDWSSEPTVSADGRFAAFSSGASNLVPGDTNARIDIFLHDVLTGQTARASVSTLGIQATDASYQPWISADGRLVAFGSWSINLVPNGPGPRGVFLHDRTPPVPNFQVYCTAGTTTQGCSATLDLIGTTSASSAWDLMVRVTGAAPSTQGILFYGLSGRQAVPWPGTQSWSCVMGPRQRTGSQTTTYGALCTGRMLIDWNAYTTMHPGALGAPRQAGDTIQAQAWFRDAQAPGGASMSDAAEWVVTP